MDGYVYRLDYTERRAIDGGVVILSDKAVEYSQTDEATVRDQIAQLTATGNVDITSLRKRLPTPPWEDMTL